MCFIFVFFGVVYGTGVCVNVCGVVYVAVCCLFLTSGCCLLCVCYCGVFSLVYACFYQLSLCVVYVDGLGYVYDCESYVFLDQCVEPPSLFVFSICVYGGVVGYFWCYSFMCEFCFLYCV